MGSKLVIDRFFVVSDSDGGGGPDREGDDD